MNYGSSVHVHCLFLAQVLGDRRGRSVPVKEEDEEGATQAREEEERILGEFSTETTEVIEELDGVMADVQGDASCQK